MQQHEETEFKEIMIGLAELEQGESSEYIFG